MIAYAHTKPGCPPEKWQLLHTGDKEAPGHLEAVAKEAAEFATAFGAAEWARLAGLWHDLGKYSREFQDYLRAAGGADAHLEERPEIAAKVDHSTAGAQHAASHPQLKGTGTLLAYLIAGHHAGLPDGRSEEAVGSDLESRLKKSIREWQPHADPRLLDAVTLRFPPALDPHSPALPFQVAFFLRMVFSALVDADFLDTEVFMSPERAGARLRRHPSMAELDDTFSSYYARRFPKPETDIQHARAEVHAACLARAEDKPGLFSLDVPTGGGKTFASLAFALRHARRHGLERVIYVIPFTSIIEQNAAEFRDALAALGPGVVVEHHSNLDPDAAHATPASRLAAENWDARVVVTTNVQFFESLFANRTSRCRKLHRIARSVVVLDEAQTLPVTLLQPCLAALYECVRCYGATTVLCTATQPALEHRPGFPIGLPAPRQIIADAPALARRLQRTSCQMAGMLTNQELALRLAGELRVLCIVNTRKHARQLFEDLQTVAGGGVWHLSALMCPEHRSIHLAAIRKKLAAGNTCRVVSTQLIEAGVDVDFPVVYRALAGLDSIAQAAGRCNREGKLKDDMGAPRLGDVWVFETMERPPDFLGVAAASAAQVVALPEFAADPLTPAAVRRFFELHYWSEQARWDAKRVMECFGRFQQDPLLLHFATAAQRFRLIEEFYKPVVVPYDARAEELLAPLYRGAPTTGRLLRAIQRYTVQIPERVLFKHLGSKLIELPCGLVVLPHLAAGYSENLGLTLADDGDGAFFA